MRLWFMFSEMPNHTQNAGHQGAFVIYSLHCEDKLGSSITVFEYFIMSIQVRNRSPL
jgi:hypothetical protein